MNMLEYLDASARTASGKFYGNHSAAIPLERHLHDLQDVGQSIDNIKKALFYGKNFQSPVPGASPVLAGPLQGDDTDLLHAILGIITEAVEFGQALLEISEGKEANIPNLIEESGDLQWYLAMLYRTLGTTFEEVGEININKLRVRYPDKFTEARAIDRDLVREGAVLTTNR